MFGTRRSTARAADEKKPNTRRAAPARACVAHEVSPLCEQHVSNFDELIRENADVERRTQLARRAAASKHAARRGARGAPSKRELRGTRRDKIKQNNKRNHKRTEVFGKIEKQSTFEFCGLRGRGLCGSVNCDTEAVRASQAMNFCSAW